MSEILSEADLDRLKLLADLIWARDDPVPDEVLESVLSDLDFIIAHQIGLSADRIEQAPRLRAFLEVGGGLTPGIDYDACFRRGIRVLSCAPAFGAQVAEMGLAFALAAGRGLVRGHEAFRRGEEVWQHDAPGRDFSLFEQEIGFVGLGSLGRNLIPLLRSFSCLIRVFDPWLPASGIRAAGCEPSSLDDVMTRSRLVYVLAVPTVDNRAMISAEKLGLMQDGSLLILLSRAHLVDFDALTDAVTSGRIQAAIDVFPQEPLAADHPIRSAPGVVLSAHRAASIRKERQAIGRMVVDDLELMIAGHPPSEMQRIEPEHVAWRLGDRAAR